MKPRLKIKPINIGISIICIFLVMPQYFREVQISSILTLIYNIIIILLGFFLITKNLKITRFTLLVLLYYIILIIFTYINHGWNQSLVNLSVKTIISCLFFEYLMINKPKYFFNTILITFEILVVINFLTILLFPQGLFIIEHYENQYWTHMDKGWLLGIKNDMIPWILFANFLSFLRIYIYQPNKLIDKRSAFLFIVSAISLYLVNSKTSFVVIILVGSFCLLYDILKISNIFNAFTYLILYAFVWWEIVIKNSSGINYILGNLLNIDSSFTGRTQIWDSGLFWISKSLYIGNGFESNVMEAAKLGSSIFVNVHNQILEILYEGGLILLFIFLILLFFICLRLFKERKEKIVIFSSWVLFVFFIEVFTEVLTDNVLFWIILLLVYHIPDISKTYKAKQRCSVMQKSS